MHAPGAVQTDSTTDKVTDATPSTTYELQKTRTFTAARRERIAIHAVRAECAGDASVEPGSVTSGFTFQDGSQAEGGASDIGTTSVLALATQCTNDTFTNHSLATSAHTRVGNDATVRFKLKVSNTSNITVMCIRNTGIDYRVVKSGYSRFGENRYGARRWG